jgi:serine/threonine protein kinase
MSQTARDYTNRRKRTIADAYGLLGYGDDEMSAAAEGATETLVGQFFAEQYEILSVIGQGGMSVVYKARHRFMDRSLSHPNIVTVHDFGIRDGEAFLVMDYLDGTDLADVLMKETRLSLERFVNIFRQTCDGLEHAHRKGVVHRDLKPSNLCLLPQEQAREQVKIVDFGIAKVLPQRGVQPTQLTQTGDIFGSPLYMSPEQCLGQALDTRSDIYSLGCVMYECITGVPPHASDSAFNTMTKHVTTTPLSFDKVCSGVRIDKSIEAVVFRCLEKRPEDRYQCVSEISADLLAVLPQVGSQSVKHVVQHPAKQRREMKFLRNGFWTMLCILTLSFIYMAFDNGTANNRGTVLEKTIWNAQVNVAQTLINWQLYAPAQAILKNVEKTADEKFSPRGPQQIALYLERDLYKKAHMYEELEVANRKITDSTKQMLMNFYTSTMQDTDDLMKYKNDIECNVNKVMAAINVVTVGRTARALTYNGMEKHAEHLLKHAREVYLKLMGSNDNSVAAIDVMLADFYVFQQETPKVRPLLSEAVTIYKRNKGLNYKSTILALMKLGQIDRDEDNFNASRVELEEALNAAGKYFPSDKTLLSKCVRSYADYCDQTNSHEAAQKLYARADALSAASGGLETE